MTKPTIAEMVRTASVEFRNCTQPGGCAICLTSAIDAVIEKHFGPMLARAAREAWWAGREYHGTHTGATCNRDAERISARIIEQMKERP